MMKTRIAPLAAAGLVLLSSACSRRPDGVLSDDEMTDVMVDMKLAESYANSYGGSPSDSIPQRIARAVLDKYGVSRADFDTTLAWYGRNFDDYVGLYDKMESRLAERQKDYVSVEASGEDGAGDLWPYSRRMFISPKGDSDGFTFSVSRPDVKPGESLRWMMRLNSVADGKMLIGVDYSDGTSDYAVRSVAGNRKQELVLHTDTARELKRVFGNFRIRLDGRPLWIDSISLTHKNVAEDERRYGMSSSRYRLPEKYDALKARRKAMADSLQSADERNSSNKKVSEVSAETAVSPEMMRPGSTVAMPRMQKDADGEKTLRMRR